MEHIFQLLQEKRPDSLSFLAVAERAILRLQWMASITISTRKAGAECCGKDVVIFGVL